ncbi:MAG: NAD(+) kinase [Gammaproteobacteria bacterium]|nr:NAD(+) kinase [Gammaproteobacteria bacterium]
MKFKTIGLITQRYADDTFHTLKKVIFYLQSQSFQVILEAELDAWLQKRFISESPLHFKIAGRETLGKLCDLVIVVGGDGSLLNAARAIVPYDVPLIGINRGTLGFLADIKPDEIETKLAQVLKGEYNEEKRFLLETYTENEKKPYPALNEVILVSADMAKMIEFEIYVDDMFMCSQRSDGLIVATPTGSTAYALSAGGPILYPNLDIIVMIPMFPHSLNNRPIVISNDKKIHIVVLGKAHKNIAYISCDSHTHINIKSGEKVFIHKMEQQLILLHPKDYDYFKTLRSKLSWGQRLVN